MARELRGRPRREARGVWSGDMAGPWPETTDGHVYMKVVLHRATFSHHRGTRSPRGVGSLCLLPVPGGPCASEAHSGGLR